MSQILVLLTASKLVLFDAETLKAIEQCDHFGTDFNRSTVRPFEQSFKAYKGKLFYLVSMFVGPSIDPLAKLLL
jgi:hypothetical protein